MSQHYSDPTRESDPHALPDVEVFYVDAAQVAANKREAEPNGQTWQVMAQGEDDFNAYAVGWFYWFCFPGCLPDSTPRGPYETEDAARRAAQSEDA